MNISNNKIQSFIDVLNNKNWSEAEKINATIQSNELNKSDDKCMYRVCAAILSYYSNNLTITEIVAGHCLHTDIKDVEMRAIQKEFPELNFEQIYLDSLVYQADVLAKEGKELDALKVIKLNEIFEIDTLEPNISTLAICERSVIWSYKVYGTLGVYSLKALQISGLTLSKEITKMFELDAFKNFEAFNNYEVKKDTIVFNSDMHIESDIDGYYITQLFFPELNGIKKWIFKKNLFIGGSLFDMSTALEVKGNTKINGAIEVPRYGLFFRRNLEVGEYILTAGTNQMGITPKFSCDGELKATFIDTGSKLKLKGQIHPDTLILVPFDKDAIEGYTCRIRKEVNQKFWREGSRETSFVWLKHEEVFAALQEGENIFLK